MTQVPPSPFLKNSVIAATLFTLAPCSFANLKYDFDDGTLQGWTTVLPADPNTAPLSFISSTAPVNRVQPESGTHFLAPSPWSGRDTPHETLYVRSPEFFLSSAGDLTFFMAGGSASANLPATDADVLATPNTLESGAMFVGLRRVSDGAFVLQKRRGGNGNNWVPHAFTAAELAPFLGEKFTLDLVDTNSGGWGWTGLDTVSIPGVSGTSVVVSQDTFLTTSITGDAVGTLSAVGGEEDESYTFSLIAGEGSEDNDKFTIAADQLQLGSFDFSTAADGSQYSIRVQSEGSPSGEVIESVLVLTAETPYLPRLIGFWDFDEGNAGPDEGGILDLATGDGGHHGTMTGGVLSADVPAALAGAGSRSLDLTGGNSHVLIDTFMGDASDNDFNPIKSPAMSVSVWVKGWPSGNWLPFVSKNGEANGWQIRRQGGNNTGTFTLRGTSAEDDPQTTSDIGPNPDWSHLVGTYDGTTRKMFVNGVELLNLADSGDIFPSTDLVMFGNRMLNGAVQSSYSNVQLDDIGIWNYALTEAEIQSLANGESPLTGVATPEITAVEFIAPHQVRLTWDAQAGQMFALNFSTDLVDWDGEINDSIEPSTDDVVPGDGNRITLEIDLSSYGLESQDKIFFRVSQR
ncbi:MAG: LamG domain-containing protein [Akkermansiaceae bacterium]